MTNPEPEEEPEEEEAECDEAPMDEQERTQTCQCCRGQMRLTGSTPRPRVREVMEMPLSSFRRAQAGAIVTLGERLPRIQAERSGDASSPSTQGWTAEIRRQLSVLMTSGYL